MTSGTNYRWVTALVAALVVGLLAGFVVGFLTSFAVALVIALEAGLLVSCAVIFHGSPFRASSEGVRTTLLVG